MSAIRENQLQRRGKRPASHRCHAESARPTAAQRDRARQLLSTEISFVPHASFRQIAMGGGATLVETRVELPVKTAWPTDLPPHLARLGEMPLLTADQERRLFRDMNCQKYQANVLRSTLNPDEVDVAALEQAEQLLAEAQAIRDQIVRANMRLVMSVVKRFVTPRNTFDELLSDGIVTLMKAVENFDFSRGFRFSTYAYRALSSNTFRAIADRTQRESHFVSWSNELLESGLSTETSLADELHSVSLHEPINQLLAILSAREQFVLHGRFAIGTYDKARTYQSLADELGLSKERVRQIEFRALRKLHAVAEARGLGDALNPPDRPA